MSEDGDETGKFDEIFESHSCSVSNEADAFQAAGPTKGKSLFVFNYYGANKILDANGLFNEVNMEDRIPDDQP